LKSLKGGKALLNPPLRTSLKTKAPRTASAKILEISEQESSDSAAGGEPQEDKDQTAEEARMRSSKQERAASVAEEAELQTQRVQRQHYVLEVRTLLHKAVHPEGSEQVPLRGRQKKEMERQFQAIYAVNQLQ